MPTCSHCLNCKIPAPHDHFVRDLSKLDKPVTCPLLLALECQYCHNKGHTVKYCPTLKNKPSVPAARPKVITLDDDGFQVVEKKYRKPYVSVSKPDSKPDSKPVSKPAPEPAPEPSPEPIVYCEKSSLPPSTIWSDIVKNNTPKKIIYQSMPPVTKYTGNPWCDCSDDEDAVWYQDN